MWELIFMVLISTSYTKLKFPKFQEIKMIELYGVIKYLLKEVLASNTILSGKIGTIINAYWDFIRYQPEQKLEKITYSDKKHFGLPYFQPKKFSGLFCHNWWNVGSSLWSWIQKFIKRRHQKSPLPRKFRV